MKNQIKTIYSDEVIAILRDYWIKYYLKKCHKIRAEAGLKNLHDIDLMIYFLKTYIQKRKKIAEKKRKKEVKNEVG